MQPSLHITWLTLLAAVLAAIAGVVIVAVLMAAWRPEHVWQKLRTGLGVALWIVPAVGVIGLVAARAPQGFLGASGTAVVLEPHSPAVPSPVERPTDAESRRLSRSGGTPFSTVSLADRLHTRSTTTNAPDWPVEAIDGAGSALVRFDGKLYATLEEAEADVTEQALAHLARHFQYEFQWPEPGPVPVAFVERFAVRDLVTEVVDKDFGNGLTAKMYRSHLRLELSPELRGALREAWRERLVRKRLFTLGGVVGAATLLLGTAAGYFRLDDATAGQYRGRLKVAAAAIVAATGLVALVA